MHRPRVHDSGFVHIPLTGQGVGNHYFSHVPLWDLVALLGLQREERIHIVQYATLPTIIKHANAKTNS